MNICFFTKYMIDYRRKAWYNTLVKITQYFIRIRKVEKDFSANSKED